MKRFGFGHPCIVMDRTAFEVCIGTNGIRESPAVIAGMLFTPSQLMMRNPQTQEVDLVPLEDCEGGAFPDHDENELSRGRQSSLRVRKWESYRLLPEFKAQVLAETGVGMQICSKLELNLPNSPQIPSDCQFAANLPRNSQHCKFSAKLVCEIAESCVGGADAASAIFLTVAEPISRHPFGVKG